MELKKNPKADLERYRFLFLEIGFVVTLFAVFLAFSWSTSEKQENTLGQLAKVDAEEEIIPITRQEQPKPKAPPPAPKVTEVLNIVDDDVQIDDELQIDDTEADQNTEIQAVDEDAEEADAEAPVFYVVEDMPEYPGGVNAMRKYIATHIVYPEIAKENGITGKVYVQFVVNQRGKIEQVKVVRGVDPSLDKEAVRVIKSLPIWKPGKQRGKPVKVSYTVPINFQLN